MGRVFCPIASVEVLSTSAISRVALGSLDEGPTSQVALGWVLILDSSSASVDAPSRFFCSAVLATGLALSTYNLRFSSGFVLVSTFSVGVVSVFGNLAFSDSEFCLSSYHANPAISRIITITSNAFLFLNRVRLGESVIS